MSPAIQDMHEVCPDVTLIPPNIRAELDAILVSEEFRSSQRCQAFLRHIVAAVCTGAADSLKERTLGIALFGRNPDYDTGADAIVRVTALETRRRLGRYNQTASAKRQVVITLRPGTYIPSIDCPSEEVTSPAPVLQPQVATSDMVTVKPSHLPQWRYLAAGISCFLLVIAFAIWAFVHTRTSVVESFWKPVTSSKKTILCTSKPNAYALRSLSVVTGDSNVALHVQDMLINMGQQTRMAITSDLSESDLREAPAVLIGSSGTNGWTARLANSFRFQYAIAGGQPVIFDHQDPTRFWVVSEKPDANHTALDYAVITRLVHSQLGPGLIAIAGSSSLSTHASAMALTDKDSLAAMLKDAPDDWQRKNLQFVICYRHAQSRDFAPQVLAAVYW